MNLSQITNPYSVVVNVLGLDNRSKGQVVRPLRITQDGKLYVANNGKAIPVVAVAGANAVNASVAGERLDLDKTRVVKLADLGRKTKAETAPKAPETMAARTTFVTHDQAKAGVPGIAIQHSTAAKGPATAKQQANLAKGREILAARRAANAVMDAHIVLATPPEAAQPTTGAVLARICNVLDSFSARLAKLEAR